MNRGDIVQTLWSQGDPIGHGAVYGLVVAAGPKTFTVVWESCLRQRIARDNRNVTVVTDEEVLESKSVRRLISDYGAKS